MAQQMIRIENRKRSTWVFQAWKPMSKDGPLVEDHENDLVIGDSANTAEVMKSHGASYSRRCPSPIAVVPKARIDAMPAGDRRVFEALVSSGEFQVTPVAA